MIKYKVSEPTLYKLVSLCWFLFWAYVLKFAFNPIIDPVVTAYFFLFLLVIYSGFQIHKKSLKCDSYSVFLILLFMFSCLSSVFVNYVSFQANIYYLKAIVVLCVVLLIVLSINEDNDKVGSLRTFTYISTLIFIGFVIYIFVSGEHYSRLFLPQFDANYLVISDLIAIASLLSLRLNVSVVFKVLILFFPFVGLLFLGSRSSMVIYILSVFVHFFFEFKSFGRTNKLLFSLIIASLVYAIVRILITYQDRFYRFFSLFSLSDDNSFQSRNKLSDIFFENLSKDWLSVLFGGGVNIPGTYVHNIFSIWQLTGLISFVITIFIVIITINKFVYRPVYYSPIIPAWTFCLLSILLSRSLVGIVFPILLSISWIVIFNKKKDSSP